MSYSAKIYRLIAPLLTGVLSWSAAVSPLSAQGSTIELLVSQSRQRQEQLRQSIGKTHKQSTPPPSYLQAKASSSHILPAPESNLLLETRVFHNPTIDANIEAYKLGVQGGPSIELRRPYNVVGGKQRGTVLYLTPTPPPRDRQVTIGVYGFKPTPSKKVPHPSWAFGPTIRTSLSGTNLQLDLTKAETSLYLNRDGFTAGPLNFKNPQALNTQLNNAVVYNAGSFAVQAMAGKKARKTAQKVYGAFQLLSSPTPAAFAISGVNEIRKHGKERAVDGLERCGTPLPLAHFVRRSKVGS